jgi:hypothetical protein
MLRVDHTGLSASVRQTDADKSVVQHGATASTDCEESHKSHAGLRISCISPALPRSNQRKSLLTNILGRFSLYPQGYAFILVLALTHLIVMCYVIHAKCPQITPVGLAAFPAGILHKMGER